MEKDVVVLTPELKLSEIQAALKYEEYKVFPVVDSKGSKRVVLSSLFRQHAIGWFFRSRRAGKSCSRRQSLGRNNQKKQT